MWILGLKGLMQDCLHSAQPAPPYLVKYRIHIKTESIRKLSNFNFQWTKTLYQNNLKHIAFFFTFFESYGCNLLSVITPKTISYGSPRK